MKNMFMKSMTVLTLLMVALCGVGVQSQKCEFCTLRPFQHKNSRYSVH
ncbi:MULTISPECIES: hypothetical protein [Bacillaceae]|nr:MULTISPECIES: hypothetical protein [Bacillaceae]